MSPERARLYAHVLVWFWPWLWWQLRGLDRWRRETGLVVLIAVDLRGNVYVRWIEDAPQAAPFRAPVSARLARALAPPDPLPCPRPVPSAHDGLNTLSAHAPGLVLPLPDT